MQELSRDIEVWRDLPNYEGHYQVGSLGHFRSLDRITTNSKGRTARRKGKMWGKKSKRSDYYIKVKAFKNGVSQEFQLHVLVSTLFVPNPHNLPVANHLDGLKQNNAWWNFEWTTVKGNNDHAKATGLSQTIGETHHWAALTNEQVLEIVHANGSYREISQKYGVTKSAVKLIKTGVNWGHLTGIKYQKKQNKLSESQIKEILKSQLSNKQLADKFGMARGSIWRIKAGKAYSNITNSEKTVHL